jgi:CPA2 family monovalent cation:H+ antiporter-2
VFRAIEPLQRWLRARARNLFERPGDPLAELPMTTELARLTGHVVLVGYGRVGRRIGEALVARHVPIVVAEENRELVERLRARGMAAVSGDASEPAVLIQAHIARARMLVVAVPDAVRARKMIEIARTLKPDVQTVARAHSDGEAALLEKESAGGVFMGEHELALAMTRHVLEKLTAPAAAKPGGAPESAR